MSYDNTEEVSCAGDLEKVASKWKPREEILLERKFKGVLR